MNMRLKMLRTIFLLICSSSVNAAPQILPQKIEYNQTYELFEQAQAAGDLNMAPPEKAFVKFKRNGNMLNIEAAMCDLDCYNHSTAPQQVLHFKGDALRLYLQPENDTRLFEIQVDCNGKISAFVHWGAGRIFYPENGKSAFPEFRAAAEKTANGWHCSMYVPLAKAAMRLNLPTDTSWKIMLIRYNYGKNHPRRDVSGYPQLVNVPDILRFALLPQ